MPAPKVDDDEFIQLFQLHGAQGTADHIGTDVRAVFRRRKTIEKKYQTRLIGPNQMTSPTESYAPRVHIEVPNGIVIVFSDAHYWPGPTTTAHRALLKMCKELKPKVVICNGDAFDGATASRFPAGMWETLPTIAEELEICTERLGEIVDASPKAKHIWNLGNHCARFEARLANAAPEFKGVKGLHLKDHFPEWRNGWATWINADIDNVVPTVVKHRWKGGTHATHNNALGSGVHFVTGHDHQLKSTPWLDYMGKRWGVSTGTLADPYGPQFAYGEDNPKNQQSGFQILHFHEHNLMTPEEVPVMEAGKIWFRGKMINV